MALLQVDSVSKNFGGVAAVAEFSMAQAENQISAIIGPNGAGKTTTFNLISGVQEIDSGSLTYDGTDITRLPSHRIQRLGIARTFQNIRLFNGLSVIENVKISYAGKLGYTVFDELVSTPRVRKAEKAIEERAMEQLAFLGLEAHAFQKPANLSYGLRRRLELARALMSEPRLLLLDEPAAGLNPAEIRALMKMIEHIHREKSLSVIIVEHHMELVMNICSTIHVMDFGRKIAEGTPQEILQNEKVLQAYLGDMGAVC